MQMNKWMADLNAKCSLYNLSFMTHVRNWEELGFKKNTIILSV